MGRFRADSFVDRNDVELALVEDESLVRGTLFIVDWLKFLSFEFQNSIEIWPKTIDSHKYYHMVAYTGTIAKLASKKEISREIMLEIQEKNTMKKSQLYIGRSQFDELLTNEVLVETAIEQDYTKALLRGLSGRGQV